MFLVWTSYVMENTDTQVEVTQFMRPDGRQRLQHTDLPDHLAPDYLLMQRAGFRFEAEMLMTGIISVTISGHGEDAAIALCPNGPEIQIHMAEMLANHDWERRIQPNDNE